MEISILATTKIGEIAEKHDFDLFGGRAAGVCYMSSSFEDLSNEPVEKTERRINQTKNSGHHSVYDHCNISFYMNDVPKIIAMILNNEKQYTTSEKSGRYTKMVLTDREEKIYNKWLEIVKTRITNLYQKDYPNFFTDSRINKLSQEIARYFNSVFVPTKFIYTTTYRQFNYLISFFDALIEKVDKTKFEEKLNPYLIEFVGKLKAMPYYDEGFTTNEKHRKLSLFAEHKVEEYYGDVYATSYKASFSCLAQAQRHRTISYNMRILDGEYYIPDIIKDDKTLSEEWLEDMNSLADIYPQATLLEINEMGTFDNFVLKMKERKCTFAQLEINKSTNETLSKYVKFLEEKGHQRAKELKLYTNGSRCTFPDYNCTAPCGFACGINETRLI